jgi:hypothetical protein
MSLSGELKGLRKCQYDSKSREEEMLHIMERTTESKPVEDRFAALMTQLTILAPCHKNEKFKDEEEWRLITFVKSQNDEIKFREGKTVIIPYTEINLKDKDGNLPIESICIGPTPYMTESESSLKILLEEKKLSNIKIIKSRVPYRML